MTYFVAIASASDSRVFSLPIDWRRPSQNLHPLVSENWCLKVHA